MIGSALDFPSSEAWLTFAKWGEQWGKPIQSLTAVVFIISLALKGGIMSINVMGTTMIILNDPKIAVDLLDKAGSELADRPVLPMASLCGWDRVLSAARVGPRLAFYRVNDGETAVLIIVLLSSDFAKFAYSLAVLLALAVELPSSTPRKIIRLLCF